MSRLTPWARSRAIRSPVEQQELHMLINLISNLYLSSEIVSWECTIDDSRLFTVKGMRNHITNLSHTSVAQFFRWNKALPIKINVFSWRASHATRSNLDKRDIDLNSTRCPVCDDDIETEEHFFYLMYCC